MLFLKSIKKIMIIIAITYISVGFLLIIKPSEILLIFEILSCGLGVAGLFLLIRYFTISISDRIKRDDFLMGGLIIAIAIIIYIYKKNATNIGSLKYIFGIMMCLSGLVKIQDGLDTSATKNNHFLMYLLLFVICVAFGTVIMIASFKSTTLEYILMGIGLIICGVSDLISTFYIASCVSQYEKKKQEIQGNVSIEESQIEEEVTKEDENSEDTSLE